MAAKIITLALSKLRPDGGTQSRTGLNQETIDEYADAMKAGAEFPPLLAFHDKSAYWIVDGFHRYHAAKHVGLKALAVEVREGTQREALLCSLGQNQAHGLKRTNDDKRKAVTAMLRDEEWRTWSDARIAEHTGVDQKTVGKWREALEATGEIPQLNERKSADGKTRNVSKVRAANKARTAKPAPRIVSAEAQEAPPEDVPDVEEHHEEEQPSDLGEHPAKPAVTKAELVAAFCRVVDPLWMVASDDVRDEFREWFDVARPRRSVAA